VQVASSLGCARAELFWSFIVNLNGLRFSSLKFRGFHESLWSPLDGECVSLVCICGARTPAVAVCFMELHLLFVTIEHYSQMKIYDLESCVANAKHLFLAGTALYNFGRNDVQDIIHSIPSPGP
jgi:hypothetical protein